MTCRRLEVAAQFMVEQNACCVIADPDARLNLSEVAISEFAYKMVAIGPHVCVTLENYICLLRASDVYNLHPSVCQREYASIAVGLFFLTDAPAPRCAW